MILSTQEYFYKKVCNKYGVEDLRFNSEQWFEYSKLINEHEEDISFLIYEKDNPDYAMPYLKITWNPDKTGFGFDNCFSTAGSSSFIPNTAIKDGYVNNEDVKNFILSGHLWQRMCKDAQSKEDLKNLESIRHELSCTHKQGELF